MRISSASGVRHRWCRCSQPYDIGCWSVPVLSATDSVPCAACDEQDQADYQHDHADNYQQVDAEQPAQYQHEQAKDDHDGPSFLAAAGWMGAEFILFFHPDR